MDAAAADGADGGHELEGELRQPRTRARARAPPSGALPAASASASSVGRGRERERCGLKKQEDEIRVFWTFILTGPTCNGEKRTEHRLNGLESKEVYNDDT